MVSALSALLGGPPVEDPRYKKQREDINMLCSNIQEYLSSYIVIGYTMNGKPVQITYGGTQQDLDALNTALHRYLLDQYMNKGMPGPGGFPQ